MENSCPFHGSQFTPYVKKKKKPAWRRGPWEEEGRAGRGSQGGSSAWAPSPRCSGETAPSGAWGITEGKWVGSGDMRPLLGSWGETGSRAPLRSEMGVWAPRWVRLGSGPWGSESAGATWPAPVPRSLLPSFPSINGKAKINTLIGQLCEIIFNLDCLDISSGVTNNLLETKFHFMSFDW